MSIEWKVEQGNLIVFEVSGQLGIDEYQRIQAETESLVKRLGEIKILVLLKDFEGWEAAKGWADTSVMERVDPYIKKMAIVGGNKWRDLVEAFTLKGLRPIPIEYFASDSDESARRWLDTD